ncbi:MAG: SGNH/GDSL hydrolase family protein [Candidatus Omnitrophica bacterium]|nr:SGNH/GDSL hydrolase family protein [Candidatus Omnitrophota bacterium]
MFNPKKIFFTIVIYISALILAAALFMGAREFQLVLKYGHGKKRVILEKYGSPFLFKAVPNSSEEYQFWKAPIKYNNVSVRRNEDTAPKPAEGTTRILAYGDSVTLGVNVSDDNTYPAFLEEIFSKFSKKKYEVLNMARGWSPAYYSFFIREDIKALSPDKVIVQIELLNDLSDDTLALTEGRDENNLPLKIHGSRNILSWHNTVLTGLYLTGHFYERTYLYTNWSRKYGNELNKKNPNTFVNEEKGPNYFYTVGFDKSFMTQKNIQMTSFTMFRTLKGMQDLCAKNDIEFLLLIIPSRKCYDDSPHRASAQGILAHAKNLAAQLGINYICPFEDIYSGGGKDLYIDFCHLTPRGLQVVATSLFKYYTKK